MCTFNGADFIEEQIASILSGDRRPDEIVVADDGSTDATLDIVNRVLGAPAAPDSIRLTAEASPLGVTRNFERAIAASTGDVIVLCDQDDVWEKNRLAIAVAAVTADPPALLHHSNASLIDGEGRELPGDLFATLGIHSADLAQIASGDAFPLLLRRNLVTGATTTFRRELTERALPFPELWLHDEWLAIIAASSGTIRTEARRLVRYRQHGGNLVGARRLPLGLKIQRVLGAEAGRTARLADRTAALVDRLRRIGASKEYIGLAERKQQFERARSLLPPVRVNRIRGIWQLQRSGGYRLFASQGRLDILRDALQSHRRRVGS